MLRHICRPIKNEIQAKIKFYLQIKKMYDRMNTLDHLCMHITRKERNLLADNTLKITALYYRYIKNMSVYHKHNKLRVAV